MKIRIFLAIFLILGLVAGPASAVPPPPDGDANSALREQVLEGGPPPPAAVEGPAGPEGPAGATGTMGPQGPAGHTPTPAEMEPVVNSVLASMDGAEVPAGYTPVLNEAVKAKFMVGYPDGSFRWQRRMTRAEATILALRVHKDLKLEIEKVDQRVGRLEIRVDGLGNRLTRVEGNVANLQATDDRHEAAIADLHEEGGWWIAGLVFLTLVVGLAAAGFGLIAAFAAALAGRR